MKYVYYDKLVNRRLMVLIRESVQKRRQLTNYSVPKQPVQVPFHLFMFAKQSAIQDQYKQTCCKWPPGQSGRDCYVVLTYTLLASYTIPFQVLVSLSYLWLLSSCLVSLQCVPGIVLVHHSSSTPVLIYTVYLSSYHTQQYWLSLWRVRERATLIVSSSRVNSDDW